MRKKKWIEAADAADLIGCSMPTLRKLMRSNNPPPFVRPSERSMLFDAEALTRWQQTWQHKDDTMPDPSN